MDKADAGEDIVIHRGIRKSYMIFPIHEDDYTISDEFRKKISKAREDYLSLIHILQTESFTKTVRTF